jgi:ferric-dicitrate binding protein FerR (iron transport regulator)
LLSLEIPHTHTNHRIAGKVNDLVLFYLDSSTVVLNSGSEVRYSSDFDKKNRTIWLDGEVVLQQNTESPLFIEIIFECDFVVKVLGTEFNIPRTTPNQTISAKSGR